MYKKILVPIDGSELSYMAVAGAASFAQKLGAEVYVLTVIEPYSYTNLSEYRPESIEQYDQRVKDQAKERLEKAREYFDKLGVKATIVMPKHTPLIKVEATEAHGAEVVLAGEVYDEAYQKACDLQKEHGYTFVHPFNDEDVIEGQGTIALEILDELPEADIILVPIGGGGLISGIACAAKQIKPTIKIIGVEPEGAASALAAINEDQVVALKEAYTIADGTAVKEIGDMTFDYIKEYVDGIITVSDYELMDAFLLLVEKHKLVAENSGILSLAWKY